MPNNQAEAFAERLDQIRTRLNADPPDPTAATDLAQLLEELERAGNALATGYEDFTPEQEAEVEALGEVLDQAIELRETLPAPPPPPRIPALDGEEPTGPPGDQGAVHSGGTTPDRVRLELPDPEGWLEERPRIKPLVERLRGLYDRYNNYPGRPESDPAAPTPEAIKWRTELDNLLLAIATTEFELIFEAGNGVSGITWEAWDDLLTEQAIGNLRPVFEELAERDEAIGKLRQEWQRTKREHDLARAGGVNYATGITQGFASMVVNGINHKLAAEIAQKHGLLKELDEFKVKLHRALLKHVAEVLAEGLSRLQNSPAAAGATLDPKNWSPHRLRKGTDLKARSEAEMGAFLYRKVMGALNTAEIGGSYPTGHLPLLRDLDPNAKPEPAGEQDGDGDNGQSSLWGTDRLPAESDDGQRVALFRRALLAFAGLLAITALVALLLGPVGLLNGGDDVPADGAAAGTSNSIAANTDGSLDQPAGVATSEATPNLEATPVATAVTVGNGCGGVGTEDYIALPATSQFVLGAAPINDHVSFVAVDGGLNFCLQIPEEAGHREVIAAGGYFQTALTMTLDNQLVELTFSEGDGVAPFVRVIQRAGAIEVARFPLEGVRLVDDVVIFFVPAERAGNELVFNLGGTLYGDLSFIGIGAATYGSVEDLEPAWVGTAAGDVPAFDALVSWP